jgi:two-component system response regulator (stage 0 sporulation protein F)/two-component system response regulator YesN
MSVTVFDVPVVLVVDGEPIIRTLLEALLPRMGFGVAQAVDGQQAIDLCRSLPGVVSVVLLDARLTHPDARATLAALRKTNPALRCCLMSTCPAELDRGRSLPGVAAVLDKPFRARQLANALRQALSDRARGTGGGGQDRNGRENGIHLA